MAKQLKRRALQSGDLDRKIDILAKGKHLNSKGGIDTTSFGTFLTGIYAHYQPGSGMEREEADRETAFTPDTFVVRYRTDINETHRLLFEGAKYDITSVYPGQERRTWTFIEAKKRN